MQHTPLDCANYSGKSDLISLLQDRGGVPNKAFQPFMVVPHVVVMVVMVFYVFMVVMLMYSD